MPKRKLTRNGIQYFDVGGQVSPMVRSPTTSYVPTTQAPANTLNGGPTQNGGLGGLLTSQSGYTAGLAPLATSNYAPVMNDAVGNIIGGYGNFSNNLSSQNELAKILMAQGAGEGPNPALNQLNQTTGQNVATQAALAAGTRGAGSNAGLLARQVAQQGAGIQQNAVGQGANLSAQEQLAARQAASGLYGQIGNQITGEQGVNTGLFTGAAGAQNAQNNSQVQNYYGTQKINADTSSANAKNSNDTTGGILGGIGSALGTAFSWLAEGGEVPAKDDFSGHFWPDHLTSMASIYHPEAKFARGGRVSRDVTPLKAEGGKVPGSARVKGDSYENDTVDAKLSPGEVVIPRSIMQSDDPAGNAAKFVASIKHKYPSKADHDEFKMALKKAISTRKVKHAA